MKERICRWSALLLAAVMVLSFAPQTLAVGAFADVKSTDWFAQPVTWALDRGITTGTSTTTFSPDMICSHAQILTFLWRAAGQQPPTVFNPFYDVIESDYYYEAAVWAYENGLTQGILFSGDRACTRADVVTYLWLLAGAPGADAAAFADVPAYAEYAQAVSWAVDCGITTGTSASTFSPQSICTRGQIVTFLYRAFSMGGLTQQPMLSPQFEASVSGGSDPTAEGRLTNGEAITQANVTRMLNDLRTDYPEGTIWSLDNSYTSDVLGILGAGCAGFALLCSDLVFGSLPITATHSNFDAIKSGDMVKVDNGRHTVVVLEKLENSIIVTEGNYNDTVHWDREFTRDSLINGNFTVTTRYP